MIRSAKERILLVALLLGALLGLFVLYAHQPVNPDAWMLAGPEDFLASPAQYTRERVVAGGIVQDTAPIRIRVSTTQYTQLLTVTGTQITPDPGDKVRVYGIFEPPARSGRYTRSSFRGAASGIRGVCRSSRACGCWSDCSVTG